MKKLCTAQNRLHEFLIMAVSHDGKTNFYMCRLCKYKTIVPMGTHFVIKEVK